MKGSCISFKWNLLGVICPRIKEDFGEEKLCASIFYILKIQKFILKLFKKTDLFYVSLFSTIYLSFLSYDTIKHNLYCLNVKMNSEMHFPTQIYGEMLLFSWASPSLSLILSSSSILN